jgi:Tfp pilus assembly protein PilN
MSLPAEKPDVPRAAPPPVPRRSGSLNLARRPFINTRPVTRVSILLWILGLLLLLGNVSLFWSYLSGSTEKRDELARLEQDVQRQRQTVSELEQRLASLNLEEQNRQVRFLNRMIAERTFSWSLLFDRLAEVLPDEVRLTRLAPQRRSKKAVIDEDEEGALGDDRVRLIIQGESRSDDGHYRFVDNLFAHPSFAEDANFSREARDEEKNLVEFDVQVTYIPGGPLPQGVVIEEVAPPPAAPPAPGPESRR